VTVSRELLLQPASAHERQTIIVQSPLNECATGHKPIRQDCLGMFRQFFRLGDADKLAERMTDDCRRN